MRDTLRLYLRYLGVSLRGQMQYRASFVMQALGLFLTTGAEFAGILALFARFGSLRGWTLPEVALLYGMVNISFATAEAFARGFDLFDGKIRRGEFDRLLVRPRSTALQVVAEQFPLARVGRLLQGLAILIWALTALDLTWHPAKALLLLAALAGGACLFSGIFVLQATLAFWTVETLEIVNTVTYGGVETAQFPLSIYDSWLRRFFTYVIPLATVNYLPSLAILGRPDPLGFPAWTPWLAPLVGVLFLLAALRVWELGVRHYRSTGS